MNVKYSVNVDIVGKPDFAKDPRKRSLLTEGFINKEASIEELARDIDKGYSICCELVENKDGKTRRNAESFVAAYYVGLDIDHGMKLEEALNHPFVKKYCTLIYTTASHTSEHNRFRIIVKLPYPIRSKKRIKNIIKSLIKIFGGDKVCIDPHRAWFGSVGCKPIIIGKQLTKEKIDELEHSNEDEETKPVKGHEQKRKLTDQELQALANRFLGPKEPTFNFTDSGNSRRLVHIYGHLLRYNHIPFGAWLIWEKTHWRIDKTDKIYEFADLTIRDIYEEASQQNDQNVRKNIANWAMKSESLHRKNAMVKLASKDQKIVIEDNMINSNIWIFNTRNFELHFQSDGQLLETPQPVEHDPLHYQTKMAPVLYKPTADCPAFKEFMYKIFANDEGLIQFVKRCIGYSLTGDVSEQVLFFCFGSGANGKTVFLKTMQLLFGDYSYKAPPELIMQNRFSQIPNDIAALKGTRFVLCNETSDNKRFDESRVKDLTGGDKITARFLHQEYFTFEPTFKLWVYGNHKPRVLGTDDGIWRRILEIPFTVTITEEKRIPMHQLLKTFKGEISGILNWAVEGYVDYQERGLRVPDTVKNAVSVYRAGEDTIGRFLNEKYSINPESKILGKDLYSVYCEWCNDQGEYRVTSKKIYQYLREKEYKVQPGSGNKIFIHGLVVSNNITN